MTRRMVRLICLGLGIALLGYTLSGLVRNRVFLLGAARADGVVVTLRAGKDGAEMPVIRFSAEGGSVVDWASQQTNQIRVGEHVSVLYMPESPSVAVIGGYLTVYGRFLLTAVAGLVLVAFGRPAWSGRRSVAPRRS